MNKRTFILLTVLAGFTGAMAAFWVLMNLGILPQRAGGPPAVLAETAAGKLTPEEEVNISIYERLSPSVVNITTIETSYDFFFEVSREQGTGSGSILDTQGHILTNHHVIEKADAIQVTLADKSKYRAKVVGVDEVNDLAVLKIDAPADKLRPIPLGGSRGLKVGQRVYAIGNPFGLTRTMSSGIISSLGRSIKSNAGFVIDDVIQTDAAINPGNSGGPLIDSSGRMIGVTTSIFTTSGGSIGIGFAVPMETVKRVVSDITGSGRVRRPWVGITGQDITPEVAEVLELPAESGVLVAYVESGSSAEAGGVQGGNRQIRLGMYRVVVGGDFIVGVDGRHVNGTTELSSYLLNRAPGDKVTLTVYRGKRKLDLTLTLKEKQKPFRL